MNKPVEEWSSDQVGLWLLDIGFEQELADNFKGKSLSSINHNID